MPSPVPRRDQSSRIARYSTSSGLPHRSGRSAPALRVSRLARRSLTLWPASLLTPFRSHFLECFSPSRYLLKPLQVLPVERPVTGRVFKPARINTPYHGTRTEARNVLSHFGGRACLFGSQSIPLKQALAQTTLTMPKCSGPTRWTRGWMTPGGLQMVVMKRRLPR
jgi:hypothetical protein